jgi:hypothetical protein
MKLNDEIIAKLQKIKRLADSGIEGERLTAQRMLKKLLIEHNLTIEDITQEGNENVYVFKKVVTDFDLTLFSQIYMTVKNVGSMIFKRGRTDLTALCTEDQAKKISDMYAFHRKQLKKELKKTQKETTTAYIYKHNLYPDVEADSENNEKMDYETLMRILRIKDGMEDVSYLLKLEQ